jgi:hypothetical protein
MSWRCVFIGMERGTASTFTWIEGAQTTHAMNGAGIRDTLYKQWETSAHP